MSIGDKFGLTVVVCLLAAMVFLVGFLLGAMAETWRWQREAVNFDHAYFDTKTKEFHWRHVETFLESSDE